MAPCGCAAVSGWWSCDAISRVRPLLRRPRRYAVPRRSLISLLAAAAPLLGGGLAWAQLQPDGPAEPQLPPVAPGPASPAAAPAPQAPLPPALPSAAAPAARMPLRPDPQQLGAAPAPRRFDESLDELVRQGVVTPTERSLIRGGGGPAPLDLGAFQKACRSGALSSQECRGGLAIRWGRRGGGGGAAGDPLISTGGGRLGADGMPLPPLTVPVSALLAGNGGSFNLASVFRVTPRPAPLLGNGNRRLLLPIIGSAVATSGFGWRLHPLLGIWRMHAGEDLAAPEGTPVVAALSGRVVSSGLAGGYGLAVEVEHQRPLRRTLYGHLSELYVKPGEWVRQGEVVGRVGSTGLSTGPHLHFELRQPADGGWVAMDPGELDPGSQLKGSDAIALLMGQLLASLERPRG
jgi:Peptidase family M23